MSHKVKFVGRVSEEEANRYVHFADFAYLSFRNNKIFDMTLPAKLQTYLACGTPTLAAAGGESAELIRRNGCGVVCAPELEALTDGVRELLTLSKEERDQMSRAAVSCYEASFTMDRLMDQLMDMMNKEIRKQECSQ